jgi:HEAT repeat protein
MAFRTIQRWLGSIQARASAHAAHWHEAFELASAPALEPGRAARSEAESVGLAFARYLTGAIGRDELRHNVERARPEAFWAALEAFTDNIGGDEWRIISRRLLGLLEVEREASRLRHPSPWRRALAARHLGLLDARATRAPLREAMSRGPALVTFSAALSLARMSDREGLRWLLDHPGATARRSRRQLVGLLKRFGPEMVHELRRSLEGWSAEAPIHLAAVEVIGLWGDRLSLPHLTSLLRSGGLEGRVAAARALGRIGSRTSLPDLLVALEDPAWHVRAQAAHALGAITDPETVPRLAARVRDMAWWVRRHAAYALARQGEEGRRALEALAGQAEDAFAAEMAREVLQLLEWERESPGGITRVA